MNNKKDKKIKIDLFKDNELKIYSKRERTPEECKSPSDILIPINDKLIETIRTTEDAVKHAIKNYGDNNLQNHISDALNLNKEFKALRAEVPSKTPKELSNYQKKYDRNDNKIKDKADKKIKEIGTRLAIGQELLHGGKLMDTKEDNELTLLSPLSTTFDPIIANTEAIHKGKAYDEGELNINIITNKNSKVKCFPYRHKGTRFGHEKEVLISSEAKLLVKENKKISETTVYKHENGKNIEKIVPIYITKIDMS